MSSPPPFVTQQPGRGTPHAEERETTILPLDSDNCTTSDTTIVEFTSAHVMARCESTGATQLPPDIRRNPRALFLALDLGLPTGGGPTGSVSDVTLVKGIDPKSPWPTLAERWQSAIRHWRFEPATVNNNPVAVWLTVLARVEVD